MEIKSKNLCDLPIAISDVYSPHVFGAFVNNYSLIFLNRIINLINPIFPLIFN